MIRQAGGSAHLGTADLSQVEQARELLKQAVHSMGGLDLLVLSAGSFEKIPLSQTDDVAFARSLDLHLRGPYALAHAAAPHLKASRGQIVFITCTSSQRPFRNFLAYSVSKGAALHLMKALAQELAPEVRVNAIAPGTVLPPPQTTLDEYMRLKQLAWLQTIGSPTDIARALQYLIDSPFVTGQELRVDGGRSA